MERPISVASSHANHQRGLSVATIHQSTAPTTESSIPIPVTLQRLSTPALFVNNLRLLDFDLLPDWPNITALTFSNQDARARIRGTEFALFQLFRFYDPMITSEKLQPFFPPLEPLQSVNLRAALYRCLNDLKKNGVLGKETVLRKSMLDECQGDKFWELCLSFSATVLRKVTLSHTAKYGRSAAEQIGLAQHVDVCQLDSMLPLAIAHRGALRRILREKQRKYDTHVQLYNTLIRKEAELQQRKAYAQEHDRKRPYILGLENVVSVEKQLLHSFGDQDSLYQTVVRGDSISESDNLLINPFEEIWARNSHGAASYDDSAKCVLQSLQHRATQQSERLRKLQTKYEKLMASALAQNKPKSKPNMTDTATPQFNQHRELTVRDAAETTTHLPEIGRNPKAARYDEILTAMRDELRRTRQHSGQGPVSTQVKLAQTNPAAPSRKTSSASDVPQNLTERESNSRSSPSTFLPAASSSLPLLPSSSSSSSNTAVPVRSTMFGRRLPSRSRSYQQPKVDSQRQPIPLKSEIFTPSKTQLNGLSPVSNTRSVLASPLEDTDFVEDGLDGVNDGRPLSLSSDAIGTVDSGVAFGVDGDKLEDSNDEVSVGSIKLNRSSDIVKRFSLADRTRMSMEAASSDISRRTPGTTSLDTSNLMVATQASDSEEIDIPSNAYSSLAERTRKSILLAPSYTQLSVDTSPHTPQSTTRRLMNYDETPIQIRHASNGLNADDIPVENDRSLTPQEELFSPEAEYESVFKARPKIALSPLLNAQKRPDSGRVSLDYTDLVLADAGQTSRSDTEEF